MTIYLGKSCSFDLLCVFFVKVYHFARARVCVSVCESFPFSFEGGILDLVVLVPDHCIFLFFFFLTLFEL